MLGGLGHGDAWEGWRERGRGREPRCGREPGETPGIREGRVRKASSQQALHPCQSSHIPVC